MINRSKPFILILILVVFCRAGFSQKQAKNLIIITTDGLRWQEVFKGMNADLATNRRFNQSDSAAIFSKFWDKEEPVRRAKLMPFFWNYLASNGQIYGNRELENKVGVSNQQRISTPGYSEIFTGFADPNIKTNEFKDNPNINLLQYLNQQPGFKGKVGAFGAWGAFPYILNEAQSKVPVIAAFEPTGGAKPSAKEKLLNKMLAQSFKPWGEAECLDIFTHQAAIEYLQNKKPRVLYIAYGETDEFAHAGQYKYYLQANRQFDDFVKEIWTYVQSHPQYKNNTYLFITTDHGRGEKANSSWTDHGAKVNGADEIWCAVLGPTISPLGEMKDKNIIYQKQFAQTLAGLLGLQFKANHEVAEGFKIPFKQ